VETAFPAKSCGQGENNVEIDPISQLEVIQRIGEEGMKPIGWYHSHTTFEVWEEEGRRGGRKKEEGGRCRDRPHLAVGSHSESKGRGQSGGTIPTLRLRYGGRGRRRKRERRKEGGKREEEEGGKRKEGLFQLTVVA
jgi:hypothetical protein